MPPPFFCNWSAKPVTPTSSSMRAISSTGTGSLSSACASVRVSSIPGILTSNRPHALRPTTRPRKPSSVCTCSGAPGERGGARPPRTPPRARALHRGAEDATGPGWLPAPSHAAPGQACAHAPACSASRPPETARPRSACRRAACAVLERSDREFERFVGNVWSSWGVSTHHEGAAPDDSARSGGTGAGFRGSRPRAARLQGVVRGAYPRVCLSLPSPCLSSIATVRTHASPVCPCWAGDVGRRAAAAAAGAARAALRPDCRCAHANERLVLADVALGLRRCRSERQQFAGVRVGRRAHSASASRGQIESTSAGRVCGPQCAVRLTCVHCTHRTRSGRCA